jgi:murein DD-endopeptidase MepM/ murein hydrolase activator NlpD
MFDVFKKTLYTLLLARHSGTKIWRLSLTLPVLFSFFALALLGITLAGMAIRGYVQMLGVVSEHRRLRSENDALRAENQNYRIQTAQLGEKIDFLETTARQLAILSGTNSSAGLGGVGGFSKEKLNKPLSPSAGTLQSIDSYNESVRALEGRYREFKDYFSDRALVAAVTPSILPVRGYVTGGLGLREDPFNSSYTDFHTGVDISAPYGSRVISPADGIVIFAGQRAGYGNIVVIDHKFGLATRYGHLWKFSVQTGQHVSRNDVLGYVGTTGRTTGPHLHFELWIHNRPVNPISFLRNLNKNHG